MAINGYTLNTAQLNAGREISAGSGAVVSFNQVVEYYFVGSGAIVSLNQNTTCTASGAIINIGQDVQ